MLASVSMNGLVACPFCRELFDRVETAKCPHCELGLASLASLPPSYDAQIEEPEEPVPPHMEVLPWTYAGRGRGALAVIAALGLSLFFAPWIRESAPDVRDLSGFDLARKLGWIWATAVAWGVMIPLALSRRSVHGMRGARVAVAFLAGIVLVTVAIRLVFVPAASALRPVRFEWCWPLYATGVLALLALGFGMRFGGSLVDLPTRERRRGDETLH